MKECSTCKIKKDVKDFSKNDSKKDGLCYQCKKCQAEYNVQYYEENKEELSSQQEEKEIYDKQYYKDHKEERAVYRRQWEEEKRKNDPIYRLKCNIRRRFRGWLNGNKKSKGTFQYINCSKEELVTHLESLFYDNPETGEPMTWENYGFWHVDHNKPLFLFDPTSEEDMRKAWAKENLHPLWAKDNLKKGKKY